MAGRKPAGKIVSVWISADNLELLDSAASVFELSRSETVGIVIESKREDLKQAIAEKTNSPIGQEPNRQGATEWKN